MSDVFTFLLGGQISPHPHKYQRWRQAAIAELSSQYRGNPLSGVSILIVLKGKHSRRCDADNVAGAILDALVQAQVLKDNNLMCVHSLTVSLEWDKKLQPITAIAIFTDKR